MIKDMHKSLTTYVDIDGIVKEAIINYSYFCEELNTLENPGNPEYAEIWEILIDGQDVYHDLTTKELWRLTELALQNEKSLLREVD
jgi:hypothetical protein